ncbi:MAG TPA: helix-turn-helix transcriptional regulator [Acetobacteraceae bacterium]|jgi:plasmid maintenance system antidote protein VapI|nr:helix-turn-helix transcriptional regulator [Acetobacteraceae bacterium]
MAKAVHQGSGGGEDGFSGFLAVQPLPPARLAAECGIPVAELLRLDTLPPETWPRALRSLVQELQGDAEQAEGRPARRRTGRPPKSAVTHAEASTPGAIIQAERERLGLARREVAERLGCHWMTLMRLENGTQEMSAEWVRRIAAALGTDPLSLVPLDAGNRNLRAQLEPEPDQAWRTIPVYEIGDVPHLIAGARPEARMQVPWPVAAAPGGAPLRRIGLVVPDATTGRVLLERAVAIVDLDDAVLQDGGLFLVEVAGRPMLRRYREAGGPRRLEPDTPDPAAAAGVLYVSGELVVVGRVVGAITPEGII